MNKELEDELIKAMKSLLSDIESMGTVGDTNGHWFGNFSEFEDGPNGVLIEWPNLAISAQALKDVLTKIESSENQEERKDTPSYWHQHNPWKDELVYVPIEELAECALSLSFRHTKEAVLEQWSTCGIWLDAYILTGPMVTAGIRFGPGESDYLSPGFRVSKLLALIDKYGGSKP